MTTATAAAAAAALWSDSDLPSDLLHDISRRLSTVADYVRFHAACKPWRDALPPPERRPVFLPWLLAPRDGGGHRKARDVFSGTEIKKVRDRGWAISIDDGAAAAFSDDDDRPVPNGSQADPLSGSASNSIALPPYPDAIKSCVLRAASVVCSDGTVFHYAFGLQQSFRVSVFTALLHPGDADWTVVTRDDNFVHSGYVHSCCLTYHDGKIVQCHDSWWTVMSTTKVGGGGRRWSGCIGDEAGKNLLSSYLVVSRGELLWVFVQVNTDSHYYKRVASEPGGLSSDAMVVSVYALQCEGGEPRWIKRDNRRFADRVFFLGQECSFAINADQFGIGGCAYFADQMPLEHGDKVLLEQPRVYKYSFVDGMSEFVEQLQWINPGRMWLTPKPIISSTEEIRKKLQFGAYFRIYAGNLPRKVDSSRLREFFSKHGKVADARVILDTKNSLSRGFGFVTMATTLDKEPAHAVAMLNGQCLDRHRLIVKMANQ